MKLAWTIGDDCLTSDDYSADAFGLPAEPSLFIEVYRDEQRGWVWVKFDFGGEKGRPREDRFADGFPTAEAAIEDVERWIDEDIAERREWLERRGYWVDWSGKLREPVIYL